MVPTTAQEFRIKRIPTSVEGDILILDLYRADKSLGSCWAHAVTGALTDRYKIATRNLLDIQLAPQNLINFDLTITGGTCQGGDHIKAYEFVHTYGISDDNCMPYSGHNWKHGFHVADLTEVADVRAHQCHTCSWDGNCGFVPE